MKTPEEWLESNRLNGTSFDCAMLHISEIKQIQEDAQTELKKELEDLEREYGSLHGSYLAQGET